MKTVLWFLLALVAIYGVIGALMYFGQRALTYFPETLRISPADAGLPQVEEIMLDTADGERLIVWHAAARAGQPVVLYFQGNGGSLRYRAMRFQMLAAEGFGVVALSYRGYGGSTGQPSEAGLIADAEAAYRFAAEHYPQDRIVLWGESLGTAIAVAIAAEHQVAGVVLEAPFTSTADVGQRAYWFVPVHLFLRDQFHSDRRIAKVTAPVLVLHGDADKVVPFDLGERLYALITAPKHFARFNGAGHNDLDRFGAFQAVLGFLRKM